MFRLTNNSLLFLFAIGQWKKYYVHLAGDTGGSHGDFLFYLNRTRQSEVFTPAESDYVLAFCPVFSEPAREIECALMNIPGLKVVVVVFEISGCDIVMLK